MRRPDVRGAMIAVFDSEGRVLLVRHTYGDRRRWELPGGWAHAGEEPLIAARRELAEEVGLDDVEVRPLGVLTGDWDFKHERLSYFAADFPAGARGRYDPVEIAELAWFDPRLPPARMGSGTRAVLGQIASYPRS